MTSVLQTFCRQKQKKNPATIENQIVTGFIGAQNRDGAPELSTTEGNLRCRVQVVRVRKRILSIKGLREKSEIFM